MAIARITKYENNAPQGIGVSLDAAPPGLAEIARDCPPGYRSNFRTGNTIWVIQADPLPAVSPSPKETYEYFLVDRNDQKIRVDEPPQILSTSVGRLKPGEEKRFRLESKIYLVRNPIPPKEIHSTEVPAWYKANFKSA